MSAGCFAEAQPPTTRLALRIVDSRASVPAPCSPRPDDPTATAAGAPPPHVKAAAPPNATVRAVVAKLGRKLAAQLGGITALVIDPQSAMSRCNSILDDS